MLPELGHAALLFAFLLSLVNGFLPLVLSSKFSRMLLPDTRELLLGSGPSFAFAQMSFVSIALFILGVCFVSNDFSVAYVASHSNTLLPLQYKISAIWGGHEGSLLLWLWILSLWIFLLALNRQKLPIEYLSKVLAVLSLVSLGFISFIIFTSNPFDRILPFFPVDGQDLNPLLQDFGLIVHPPMLYMGYVGFAIPFAFAVAGLLQGEFNRQWAAWSRPWAKSAWAFLGIGIALGSWWAYYELGWGGWWFWDPVENASFMPWLAGAALIHSLLVCEKRDGFRVWTVLLSIIAFSLSLLGTFLVRSGVLTSVHAFASDPSRGLFILIFLGLVVGLSLLLFMLRAEKLSTQGYFSFTSKEFFLILNNILLLVACATVLLGTLFPIISDVLSMGKISVGPPYFNALFLPLSILLMLLFVFVPQLKWKQSDFSLYLKTTILSAGISLLVSIAVTFFILDVFYWQVLVFIFLLFWASLQLLLSSGVLSFARFVNTWKAMPVSRKNMHFAHFGFVISLFGIVMTSMYSDERDISLGIDESVNIAGYEFIFKGVTKIHGPNYLATRGEVAVNTSASNTFALFPEKRKYFMQEKPMTEAAINPGFTRDIYVALGEDLGAGKWSLRIYHKPFVRLIWLGALIMSLSCLFYVLRRKTGNNKDSYVY